MATAIEMPGREVREQALTWPEKARALRVEDAASCQQAAELLKGIKALRLKVAETFRPHIRAALETHRGLIAEERKADAPLIEAEGIIKRGLGAYEAEQRRKAQEEEQRRREEARKAEEQRVLEQAAAMEREGTQFGDEAMVAEANALIEQPVEAPPVAPVLPETPKVAGVSYRSTWRAQVSDLTALVRFVASNPSHINLLSPNMTALNGQARSLKGALKIPGVQPVESRDVAVRGQS